jgi:ABC-type phosphate transport system permease subunit
MTLSRLARSTAMLLIPALLSNSLAFAAKPIDPAAMKAKVQARGVGQGVRVTLADKTETKGLIVSIADQSFALKVKGADQPQEIQFAQITGVHNDKMGTGTKIIIVVAVVGVVIGIVAAVFVHKFNSGFKGITI